MLIVSYIFTKSWPYRWGWDVKATVIILVSLSVEKTSITPWTGDINWTYIRRLDVLNILYTFNLRPVSRGYRCILIYLFYKTVLWFGSVLDVNIRDNWCVSVERPQNEISAIVTGDFVVTVGLLRNHISSSLK